MTGKERFMNTLMFKPVDRVPFVEIAAWPQTLVRWKLEGLPEEGADSSFMLGNDYFGFEGYDTVNIDAIFPFPRFEEQVLHEDERHIKFSDGMGRTRVALREGTVGGTRMSMDSYIDFPLKDRSDFERMRPRYRDDCDTRYPTDWDEIKDRLLRSDKPITLLDPLSGTFGFYSMLRNWFGTENLSYLWYDDPALISDCLDFLCDFVIRLLERAATEIEFDYYFVHEDMSGKGGPLVSPEMFGEFLAPRYRRFIAFLRSHGVKIILVDTDGDFEVLIPEFLNVGVNGFGPIERASGMDPVRFRKEYGNSFCMIGGIDKREIAKGRREIEKEVHRTIVPLMENGGYIPTIDHSVPPDVSLDNFRFYLELKWKALNGEL